MRVHEITLAGLKTESLRVCLLQLPSPFYGDMEAVWQAGRHVFAVTAETEANYRRRIHRLFKSLDAIVCDAPTAQVIVMPEYAFLQHDKEIMNRPADTLSAMKCFAQAYGVVLIGNCYSERTRTSNSFLIVPREILDPSDNGYEPLTVLKAKATVSQYDTAVLTSPETVPDELAGVIRFWWHPNGDPARAAYGQILTCKDYLFFTSAQPLRQWPDVIRLDKPGILITPMCTPEIKSFEARALSLLRDVDMTEGERSIVSCFCNATSLPESREFSICGQTQVISPFALRTEVKQTVSRGVQGCVIAEIDVLKCIRKPTPTNDQHAQVVLISARVLELEYADGGNTKLIDVSAPARRPDVTINPMAMSSSGLRKVYGFLRVENYHTVRTRMRERFQRYPDLSVFCHGIYGFHDVLMSSWEEFGSIQAAKQLVRLRLWPMVIGDRAYDQGRFGICIVNKVMKFRGQETGRAGPTVPFTIWPSDPGTRENILAVLHGQPLAEATVDGLVAQGIAMRTPLAASDITGEERNQGKMEFLILVSTYSSEGPRGKEDAKREFEEWLLPALMVDDRVRTIEDVASDGIGYCDADYIVHLVGDLADLNEVVLGVLHGQPGSHVRHLHVASHVVIPADPISLDSYPAFMERHKGAAVEPVVFQIIDAWKQDDGIGADRMHVIPSVIYLIPDTTMRRMLQAYFLADTVRPQSNKAWMRNFYSLSYAICCGIAGPRLSADTPPQDLLALCRSFISDLANEVEDQLTMLFMLFERIARAIKRPETVLEQTLNALVEAITTKTGNLDISRVALGTAGHVLEMLSVYYRRKDRDQLSERAKQVAKTGEDVLPTLSALAGLQAQLDSVVSQDVAKELRAFAETRNLFFHRLGGKTVDYDEIMQGAFFGLRMLDRMRHLEL